MALMSTLCGARALASPSSHRIGHLGLIPIPASMPGFATHPGLLALLSREDVFAILPHHVSRDSLYAAAHCSDIVKRPDASRQQVVKRDNVWHVRTAATQAAACVGRIGAAPLVVGLKLCLQLSQDLILPASRWRRARRRDRLLKARAGEAEVDDQ